MNETSKHPIENEDQSKKAAPLFKCDVLAKSIATGVAVSTINHTGRSFAGILIKHPLLVFGFGLTAGYFVGKYRKKIISIAEQAADHSQSFVLRQKEKLMDFVAETQEDPNSPDDVSE